MGSSALAILLLAGAAVAQPCATPRFGAPARLFSPDRLGVAARQVITADFTGDGVSDVAILDEADDAIALLPGTGDGRFGAPRVFRPGGARLLSGDADGDGKPELVVVREGEVQTLFVGEAGDLRAGPITPLIGLLRSVDAVADMDGDRFADLLVTGNRTLTIQRGDGLGGFDTGGQTYPLPGSVSRVNHVADFNGDGRLDLILLASYYQQGCYVLLSDGRGGFEAHVFSTAGTVSSSTVGDFDGDGLADLAVHDFHVGAWVTVYFGDRAEGILWRPPGADVGVPGGPLVAADVDGDGHLDLVANLQGRAQVLFGDGSRGSLRQAWLPALGFLASIDANRDGFSDLIVSRAGGVLDILTNTCGSSRPDVVLPSLVSLNGVGGVRFESQLALANRSFQPMQLDFQYTAARGFGSGSGSLTLPKGQRTYASAFDLLRSIGIAVPAGEDAAGSVAVRVTSGAPTDFVAQVRTTAVRPGAPGTGGVAYAGVPFAHTIDGGAWIPWLREDARDRTNVALVHAGAPGDGPITVRMTIPGGGPTREATLAPGELLQWDRVLGGSGMTTGYAHLERIAGSAPYLAYAIVNDEGTGDGSFVTAVSDRELSFARGSLVVPAIVETGRFESELVVTNLSDAPRALSGSWKSELLTTKDLTARFTLVVPAHALLDIADFVQHLRDGGVAGIPTRGPDIAGALSLTPEDGDLTTLLAGARTSTVGGGGRYGVFTPAIPSSSAASGTAWLFGLRQDGEVRTNLALVSTADAPENVYVELFSSGGTSLGTRQIAVDPGRWVQIANPLGEANEGFARIFGSSFLAYAVINDGAQPGQGSGDGSYVPMQTW